MTDHFPPAAPTAPPTGPHHSIGEVLSELQAEFPEVSISKIRFLESRGLVSPHRAPSGYRKFVEDDVERLRWILTMQRDHFLPLRVIKERLEAGQTDIENGEASTTTTSVADSFDAPVATVDAGSATMRASRFRPPGPPSDDLSIDDFSRLSDLSAKQIDELIRFGIIDPTDTEGGHRFSRDGLRVAKAAAKFLDRGVEARHLKAWRVAAEREAGLIEQIVGPIVRGKDTRQACEVADELIDMGNTIREAIIVRSLRNNLGLSSDEGH